MAPVVSYSPFPILFLVGLLLIVLAIAAAAAIVRYQRTRRRGALVAAVALGLGLAVVGGVVAYASVESYVLQYTWRYDYDVGIQVDGSASGSLIVPVPGDETLLTGLTVMSGRANWSFINTSRGRGLFVGFVGPFDLGTHVSLFPPPAAPPDTSPTMTVLSNCTMNPSNCTGPPTMWIFYSGPAGAQLGFSTSGWYANGDLKSGWATYESIPPPVPLASPRTFL